MVSPNVSQSENISPRLDSELADSTGNNCAGASAPNDMSVANDTNAAVSDGSGPSLIVHIGTEAVPLVSADLGGPEIINSLRALSEDTAEPVLMELVEFFAWPDEDRSYLWSLLKNNLGRFRLRLHGDIRDYDDPFELVVANLPGNEDIRKCTMGRRAAIECAAVFVAEDAWDIAARRIAESLKAAGASSELPQSIRKAIATVASQASRDEGVRPADAARDFINAYRENLRMEDYQPVFRYYREDFYVWTGCCWEKLADKEIEAKVTRYLQGDDRVTVTRKFVGDVITNLRGIAFLRYWRWPMPFWVESEDPLEARYRKLVTFRNGMLDLDETLQTPALDRNQLYALDSRFFSTVYLPYEYDVEAACPLWLQTLDQVFPRESDEDKRIDVLQEFMGLSLLPGEIRFEKFLICVGRGANGKSTILRAWEAMLGSANVSHVPLDAIGGEFRIGEMEGKLANIASDMKRLERCEEGLLKGLVSGEPIQVNRKYKSPITMIPTARLIFATNDLPQISDRSDGVWRRMIAMPFRVQFNPDQQDRQRANRLLEELPGIFNWALEGARRLFRQGQFTACALCTACADEHRVDSDPFLQFVDENVSLGQDLCVSTNKLYTQYVQFCVDNGRKPKGSSEFGKQVLSLAGVTRSRQGNGSRVYEYCGIDLRRHTPSWGRLSTISTPRGFPYDDN